MGRMSAPTNWESFAREKLTAGFPERDASGAFFREGWDACAEAGFFEFASQAPVDELFDALQALGRGTPDLGFLLSLHAHLWGAALPLQRNGETKFLPDLLSGKTIGTHAVTEPDAGSDLAGMTTVARREGDGYRLAGTKTYITNAPIAGLFLVYAKLESADRDATWGVFAVRSKDPGVSISKTFTKMGLRTAPMGEVVFDTPLPPDRLLGSEGSGLSQFHTALEMERAGIFASVLGVMESQLARTIARARERRAFDRPIGSFQGVANRIVDMKLRVETGRGLLRSFVEKKAAGKRAPMESSLVKLHLSEAFVQSSIDAVRIHGALGYVTEGGIEHHVRDAVGGLLLSGTPDIQRATIAKLLGLGVPLDTGDRGA